MQQLTLVVQLSGGNAFNDVINTHLWSGSTAPTDGYVLSWNTSLLAGNGDYEWVAQSGGGGTWATLGDKDGASGPTDVVLGRNAVGNGTLFLINRKCGNIKHLWCSYWYGNTSPNL